MYLTVLPLVMPSPPVWVLETILVMILIALTHHEAEVLVSRSLMRQEKLLTVVMFINI
jgi:hypothetical protein